jgi:hypothetical protein
MLRKVLWSGLVAGIASGTAIVSQRLATAAWRLATGGHPPENR